MCGAHLRIRTANILITKQALYQLELNGRIWRLIRYSKPQRTHRQCVFLPRGIIRLSGKLLGHVIDPEISNVSRLLLCIILASLTHPFGDDDVDHNGDSATLSYFLWESVPGEVRPTILRITEQRHCVANPCVTEQADFSHLLLTKHLLTRRTHL